MKRLVALCWLALAASAGAARADSWLVVPNGLPKPADATSVAPAPTAEPAATEQLPVAQLLPIWKAAGAAYGVPWTVLAAINKIESNFGENGGPSSAGAIGWMQFMPETWRMYGTDANADGVASPWNPQDAIYSAARYLADSGARTDLRGAIFAYNHAGWYVDKVMSLAAVYAAGGAELAGAFSGFAIDLSSQQADVATATEALSRAAASLPALRRARVRALRLAATADLISDRLDAQRRAALLGERLGSRVRVVARLRAELTAARNSLSTARAGTQGAALGPVAGYVASTPSFSGSLAFPVGGGQALVSVAPSAGGTVSIAAPAGSPAFAFADVTIQAASPEPDGDCGIGATVSTGDGETWTYCHLAYLDPVAVAGAALRAGTFVGLVGQTGSAPAPGLTIQLHDAVLPSTPPGWLAPFAGSAFRWQGASSSAGFAVVPADDPTLNSAAASAER